MKYSSPIIEIEKLETDDIILASSTTGGNTGAGGGNETGGWSPWSVANEGGEVLTVGGLAGEGAVGSSLANNLFGIR